jgi:tripartite-type tricarboxylate transporter receptor subunit TctC
VKALWIAFWAAALVQPLHAADMSAVPIRVIVNAAAGGVADRAMRVMAPHLGEKLGAHIIVENRPGGEGYIGQQEVARAKPDGQTFLFSAGSMIIITPQLVPRADFDPRKSLTPVAPAVGIPMHLLVHPSLQVDSAKDLISYAKANPDKLSYGSAGSGTALHIAGATFSREAGITMKHVPYKGASDALKDFLGGHFQVIFDPGLASQYVQSGRVKMLAVAGNARDPLFPNVPTLDEIGIKGVDGGPYFGIFAPKGVKPEIIDRTNAALASVLQLPDVRQQLTSMSLVLAPTMKAAPFAAYLASENTRYEKLLGELGIRGQ